MKSSVLIVDDHPLFRRGVRQLIAMDPDLEVMAEAASGEDAVRMAIAEDPDLILLDLNMKGIGGYEALQAMRAAGVTSRIVMLTVSDSEQDVLDAIRGGADGYLLKDMEPEDLLVRIKEAALGKMVLSEQLTKILATAVSGRQEATPEAIKQLTSREREILQAIAHGMSNKMVARKLDIAEGTVKVHVKNLLKKLNLRSRVEAAVWAVNHGLD